MFPFHVDSFANAFGFSGFNEMKQMFKQHLMEETANYRARPSVPPDHQR